MHFRRLAALALGLWLGGSVVVMMFTAQNSRIVDEIVRRPAREAVDVLVKVQESDLRMLLNYHATEGNHWLRSNWELVQLVLGGVTLLALFLGTGRSNSPIVFCILMIATVAFLHFFMTPQIQRLELGVDFTRPEVVSVTRDRLRSLQTGYQVAEYVKLALGGFTAIGLLKRASRSRRQVSVE
jgi:hypothetical protein